MSPFPKIAVIQTLHSEPDICRIETTECAPAHGSEVFFLREQERSKGDKLDEQVL